MGNNDFNAPFVYTQCKKIHKNSLANKYLAYFAL